MVLTTLGAGMACVLIGAVLPPASSSQRDTPTRVAFARAMGRIKVYNDWDTSVEPPPPRRPSAVLADVLRILGEPDDILTPRELRSGGEGETELRYGTDRHGGFATLGAVRLDARGRVRWLQGAVGTPSSSIPETQLRALLRTIDSASDMPVTSADRWNPVHLIRAVNKLHPLGRERILSAVSEYVRLTLIKRDPDLIIAATGSGVFALLGILFERPGDRGVLFPRTIVTDGVPLMLESAIGGTGSYTFGPEDLEPYKEKSVLRKEPLRPTDSPLDLFDAVVSSRHWPDERGGDAVLRYRVMCQLIRLVGAARPDRSGFLDKGARDPAIMEQEWKQLRESLNGALRWNTKTEAYEVR